MHGELAAVPHRRPAAPANRRSRAKGRRKTPEWRAEPEPAYSAAFQAAVEGLLNQSNPLQLHSVRSRLPSFAPLSALLELIGGGGTAVAPPPPSHVARVDAVRSRLPVAAAAAATTTDIDDLSEDVIAQQILPLCDLKTLSSLLHVSRAWHDHAARALVLRQAGRWTLGGRYARLGAKLMFSGGQSLAAHGSRLVTAGSAGIASRWEGMHYAGVWDAGSGELLRSLDCETYVWSVAVDGERAACGCHDATIRVFALDDGAKLCSLPIELPGASPVWAISIRGVEVACGGGDIAGAAGGVRLWSLETCRVTERRLEHCGFVTCVSLDARGLSTASCDHTARVWRRVAPARITQRCILTLHHPAPVTSIQVDGYTAATGCEDGVLRTWDVSSGDCTRQISVGVAVQSVALCGDLLVCGGWEGTLSAWSLEGAHDASRAADLDAHLGIVCGVAILPSGQLASLETEAPTRANVFSLGKLCVWEPHARPAPPGGGAAAPVLPNRRRRLSPWAAVDCLLVAVGTFSIFLVAVLVAVLVLARSPHSLVAPPAQSPSLAAHGPLSDAVNESQLPPAPSAAANAAAAEACAA